MKKHFFFIFQQGWRQIVLPNGEVINLTFCDDGCYVETEIPMEEAVKQLNEFIGHPIVNVWCDSNSIANYEVFEGAKIVNHHYHDSQFPLIFINTSSPTDYRVNYIVKDGEIINKKVEE